jgi:hypothetical protein
MASSGQRVAGVYREEVRPETAPVLATGVPAILVAAQVDEPLALGAIGQLPTPLAAALGGPALAALRGFFACGGRRCHLVPIAAGDPDLALARALEHCDLLADADLLLAPELAVTHRFDVQGGEQRLALLQRRLLAHCASRGRFAILDAPMRVQLRPEDHLDAVNRHARALRDSPGAENGALYFPWLRADAGGFVPPSGHVAGVYAATDLRRGVHKAPANEPLTGVVDLELRPDAATQSGLEDVINCIRALPGRGVRIWGARTLSSADAARHVSVRRLLLTLARWLERRHHEFTFEPNEPGLWARILRVLDAELAELHRRGAFVGATPQDAYYLRCDAETNPPELRATGVVAAEIGVAPVRPRDFIVLRLGYTTQGISVTAGSPAT